MNNQNIEIICPKEMTNQCCYPLGYVLGCSVDLIEFDLKFRTCLLSSSLPITIGCSDNEFMDCFDFAIDTVKNFKPRLVDMKGMNDFQIKKSISENSGMISGYLNCNQNRLEKILNEFDFYNTPGMHLFHLQDAIVFESNNNHIYLRPLKYRFIDAILVIHFWSKSRGQEVDYVSCVQSVIRGGYRDAKELVDKYVSIIEKRQNCDLIFERESYHDLTYKEFLESTERSFLLSKIKENSGNITQTAKKLNISRNTLKKKAGLNES